MLGVSPIKAFFSPATFVLLPAVAQDSGRLIAQKDVIYGRTDGGGAVGRYCVPRQ
jgi:hypothetical protein